MRAPLAAVALLGLTGCVAIDAPDVVRVQAPVGCPPGEEHQQVAQIFMGRNIGQTLGVSEEAFAGFLEREVATRFPDGYTVQDGQGMWRYEGVVYKEPGKVVHVMLRRDSDRAKLREIAYAYEDQFRQDAVLTQVHSACVSFWLARERRGR